MLSAPTGASSARGSGDVDVVGASVEDLRSMLEAREVTSVELVRAYQRRIAGYEEAYDDQPGVNAVIGMNKRALAEASGRDVERERGEVRGPLHGIPVVVKDNFDTADMPTSSGSQALRDMRPWRDATQVRRLRDAGAIVLAKTNLHEFAVDIYTISSLGGQTRNPYDQRRHPGGSSGGTGAAVAGAFAPVGLGTDTCGSIRIPSAHNNLVGVRPTMGLSSRAGIAPLAATQDTGGPLATSVEGAALVLDATVGYDPRDPVTEASRGLIPNSYLDELSADALKGARVGIFVDYFGESPQEQRTNEVVNAAIADMAELGAEAVELDPQPEMVEAALASNRVSDEFERDLNAYLAESADGEPRWLAQLEPPHDEVTLADIVSSGQVTPSVLEALEAWVDSPELPNPEYEEKIRQAKLLRQQLTTVMDEYELDALVYPTVSEPPTPIGTTQSLLNCQLAANSGLPALSVPAGLTPDGLPVGVELLGRPFSEPELLGMAYAYEQATQHRTPPDSMPPLTR